MVHELFRDDESCKKNYYLLIKYFDLHKLKIITYQLFAFHDPKYKAKNI